MYDFEWRRITADKVGNRIGYVNILSEVIQRLVDKGNSVIIIEHNLDVIKVADYLIDMGPGGGKEGGRVVALGTPEEVAENRDSETGKFLAEELKTGEGRSVR